MGENDPYYFELIFQNYSNRPLIPESHPAIEPIINLHPFRLDYYSKQPEVIPLYRKVKTMDVRATITLLVQMAIKLNMDVSMFNKVSTHFTKTTLITMTTISIKFLYKL